MIKIDFEMTDGTYIYKDALHLEDDHSFSDSDIEQMKQNRFLKWVSVVTAPPIIEDNTSQAESTVYVENINSQAESTISEV